MEDMTDDELIAVLDLAMLDAVQQSALQELYDRLQQARSAIKDMQDKLNSRPSEPF